MRRHFISLLTLLAAMTTNAGAQNLDKWKAYMAYGKITDIEPAGNMVYVLSSGDLFSYNITDGSVATYDKVFPLSECTISQIAWNNTVKKLIIVYDNYNIDLLDNKLNVTNIAGYYDKTMTVSKDVNKVVIEGSLAYLCTAFGLVQIDMKEGLILDTYNLGKNVTDCAFSGNKIYVNTSDGILAADKSANLLDKSNWHATTDNVSFNHANDIATTWDNGYLQYVAYDKTNKCYWTNQEDEKLQAYTVTADGTKTVTLSDINPVGTPKYNTIGFLKIRNGKLYTCNGGEWDREKPATIQVYDIDGNTWTTYDDKGIAEKYGIIYKDMLCLDIDPKNDNHVMAGSQSGLYEFLDGKLINRFDYKNSPISFVDGLEGDPNYQIITSLFYDKDNTLWVINHQAINKGILKYSADGKWSSPDKTINHLSVNNAKIMGYDSHGRIWINNGRNANPGVYCYSADGNNLYSYTHFVNEDMAEISGIERCKTLAEDRSGNIWVGTNVGLFELTEEYQRDPSLGFYQVKVPRNDGTNYADYLLAGLDITTMAIDNADRKWIGTSRDGVYVISSDNMVQEAHFLASNSCLLADGIFDIEIDKQTGTVYIGTEKGLCSVESNAVATNESMSKDNVWAYPNPVKPDYTGLINIVGLAYDSDVKITTTNGVLVAEGRSTGGSFQWDGCDKKGRRVASGIYMVNTATQSGDSGTVCKIAVIN